MKRPKTQIHRILLQNVTKYDIYMAVDLTVVDIIFNKCPLASPNLSLFQLCHTQSLVQTPHIPYKRQRSGSWWQLWLLLQRLVQ